MRSEEGLFRVVASSNRGGADNMLEAVTVAHGTVWAVGSDQGQTKGESLVLRARSE